MKSKIIGLLILLITGFYSPVSAQMDSVLVDSKFQEILAFVYRLPPLEELVERAHEASSLVKSRDALILVKQNELSKIKHDWVDILSFQGNVGYGNGFIDVNQNNLADAVVSNVNTLRFNIGVAVNLSPSYWVERKYEMNIRKAHLSYERAMKDQSKMIVQEKVTGAYLMLEYYRNLFLKATAGFESNRATVRFAEKQFLEGTIDISFYNDIQLKSTKLALEIEDYKRNLKKAYYDLVDLLGGTLNN